MNFRKIIGLALIIISALLMLEYHLGRLPVGSDIARQYVAARQLANGHGLVFPLLNPEDLSKPILRLRTEFPPGLSVLMAPLFLVFDDVRFIHTIFGIANLLLFLFLSYKLLTVLARPPDIYKYLPLILFFLAINGRFAFSSASTDMINVNLSLLCGLFLLKYYQTQRQSVFLALACLMLVLCVYFRYAYFPALLVLPVFFMVRILLYKQKEMKELLVSILYLGFFALPFLSHILYNNSKTEYIAKVSGDNSQQFYLENLVQANPFPMEAFFNLIPVLKILGITSEFGHDRGYMYSNWLHFSFYFVSLIILIPAGIYFYNVLKQRKLNNPDFVFGWFSVILTCGIILLIAVGSVLNPSQHPAYNWSWAKVARYYIFPIFLIQLSYFLILINSRTKLLRIFVWAVLIGSISFSSVLKIYNYSKNYRFFDFEHNMETHSENAAHLNWYNLHKALPSTAPEFKVLFIDHIISHRLFMESTHTGLNDATVVMVPESATLTEMMDNLNTSRPVEAYFITESNESNPGFLQNENSAQKFIDLPHDLTVYKFQLLPDGPTQSN